MSRYPTGKTGLHIARKERQRRAQARETAAERAEHERLLGPEAPPLVMERTRPLGPAAPLTVQVYPHSPDLSEEEQRAFSAGASAIMRQVRKTP